MQNGTSPNAFRLVTSQLGQVKLEHVLFQCGGSEGRGNLSSSASLRCSIAEPPFYENIRSSCYLGVLHELGTIPTCFVSPLGILLEINLLIVRNRNRIERRSTSVEFIRLVLLL